MNHRQNMHQCASSMYSQFIWPVPAIPTEFPTASKCCKKDKRTRSLRIWKVLLAVTFRSPDGLVIINLTRPPDRGMWGPNPACMFMPVLWDARSMAKKAQVGCQTNCVSVYAPHRPCAIVADMHMERGMQTRNSAFAELRS